ncbi:MAG: hypothetical protein JWO41_485 [Candidatus Saccharibacteria bacterium]|nr:hypothetical protein [Candidatus Saccharibacteria bacterium]
MSELPTGQIREILEPLYTEIEAELPFMVSANAPIWAQPICRLWAQKALSALEQEMGGTGLSFEHIVCDPTDIAQRKHGLEPVYHHYVKATGEDLTMHVIDGTYLQFARQAARLALPHVLVAPASQAPNSLVPARIPPDIFFVWRPDRYDADVFHRPQDLDVA